VIGVDYDARKGGDVFDWLKPYIALAPRSTARGGDNPSGVYFLRVPDHLLPDIRDRHLAEFGTEAVRPQHRYAAVWPSVHKDTGTVYEWYLPGETTPHDGPPSIDLLPGVPEDVFLAGMAAAPCKGSASRSGLPGAPKRKIEAHELGSIKALMAGYFLYESAPDRAMAASRTEHEDKRVRALLDDLEALTAGSDPWEPSVGSLALALYSIALAPWSKLTPREAHDLVVEHGPTCEKAAEQGVHSHAGSCWTETNLSNRAARSLSQHDGAWTQLPPNLRGKSLPGAPVQDDEGDEWDVVDGNSDSGGGDASDSSTGGGDDFFESDDGEDEGWIRLTLETPMQDPPEPFAHGLLFKRSLNILSGVGGSGKSTLASLLCWGIPTAWISSEEDQQSIHARAAILRNEDVFVPPRVMTVRDMPRIVRFLDQHPEIELMVLDNLQAFAALTDNAYQNEAVRSAIEPLTTETLRRGIAILGLSHPPKGQQSAVGGSGAWEQVARRVLLATSAYLTPAKTWSLDRDAGDHFILVHPHKGNYVGGAKKRLFKTSEETVPIKTTSGATVTDWRATLVEDEALTSGAYEAVKGLPEGDKKPARKRDEIPPIDNPAALVTGHWVEIDQLAARISAPVNRVISSLARYELVVTKAAEGRLAFVNRTDEPIEHPTIEPGTFTIPELMARLNVTQQVHLLWLLTHLGVEADVQGDDTVVVTRPEQDETDSALAEAGLEDLA
jgi:hypothetical protein